MIPLKISLSGFMSYRQKQTLLFDGSSLWVLAGPNGAGKSAIFDAITFALYGRPRPGAQQVDLINHHVDRLEVEFDFLVGVTAYRVRRTVPRRGRSTRGAYRLTCVEGESAPLVDPIENTEGDRELVQWVERTVGLKYEAFTASVLLMQGQSEQLLHATPKERYQVLAALIDLSEYERLHKKADRLRHEFDGQVEALAHRLKGLNLVDAQQVTAAEEAVKKADAARLVEERAVEQLTELHGQATLWERLAQELGTARTQHETAMALVLRAREIEEGFSRWRELERVLPVLGSVLKLRGRLCEQEEKIETLNERIEELVPAIELADKSEKDATAEVASLTSEHERLRDESMDIARRVAQVAPMLEYLRQLEGEEAALVQVEQEIAQYPSDLEAALQAAEQEQARLTEAQQALVWLQQVVESREALEKAVQTGVVTSDRLKQLHEAVQQHDEAAQRIADLLEVAHKEERDAYNAASSATERSTQAGKRLQRFLQASSLPTCQVCGQPIDEEHALKEKARLEQEVATEELELKSARERHGRAVDAVRRLDTDKKALGETQDRDEKELHKVEVAQHKAQQEEANAARQLNRAYKSLPASYQLQVSLVQPSDAAAWLDTSYPSEEDLSELELLVSRLDSHAAGLRTLRGQFAAWERLDERRRSTTERLEKLKEHGSLEEALAARAEEPDLTKRQETCVSQLSVTKSALLKAQQEATRCKNRLEGSKRELHEHNNKLAQAQASAREITQQLNTTLATLPEQWTEAADSATDLKLAGWNEERDRLSVYSEEAQALVSARESQVRLDSRIAELEASIKELPNDARCPAQEVTQRLEAARVRRNEALARCRTEEAALTRLLEQQARWVELHEAQDEAARQHHVYSLLTNLLGRDGLQLHLLRRAERAVVDLANEVLDGLSRGSIRLELFSADEGAPSDEALDLVVYNNRTGARGMPVALASGSQRFRIAVSLALAMGRYAGEEAQRIESVIIDEGFGSLDKQGRDDMIYELNELKQQLARIILVSHEEEFAGAFSNGYSIQLVDGQSQVSLRERSL